MSHCSPDWSKNYTWLANQSTERAMRHSLRVVSSTATLHRFPLLQNVFPDAAVVVVVVVVVPLWFWPSLTGVPRQKEKGAAGIASPDWLPGRLLTGSDWSVCPTRRTYWRDRPWGAWASTWRGGCHWPGDRSVKWQMYNSIFFFQKTT